MLAELSDVGNARKLLALFGRDLRYSHGRRKWLIWDGTRWVADNAGRIELLAKRTVQQLFDDASSAVREMRTLLEDPDAHY